ncbi:MAG: SEC-C domain-containing protein [Bacteroidaceae bacterium]|nr:SEC-C domain-containing protein [Bacteroidaceae bacterium]
MSKVLDKYRKLVDSINMEYNTLCRLSNDELRTRLSQIATVINDSENKSKALDKYLVSTFAIIKETARRFKEGNIIVTANDYDKFLSETYDFVAIDNGKAIYKNRWDAGGVPFEWNMVHYDEQLLGGILLHKGYAVEMLTGEGKTLVATLPVMLNALTHNGVHMMTVNSYLSKRDFELTRPIYMFYGLTADCIEYYLNSSVRRKKAYEADITFGTNSSFTFDYLCDHLAIDPSECVQQKHTFAIIDELDSILIDDAGIPHIVGGGNYYNHGKYYKENLPIVKELLTIKCDQPLYISDASRKKAEFTNEGKSWLASKKQIPDLFSVVKTYEIDNYDDLNLSEKNELLEKLFIQNVLYQLLVAFTVYEKDIDYVVDNGKIKIIDQNTGRIKESNRWKHGLHTAIEVKEGVEVQNDFDGMAVISLKNYFKLYNKVAGMSGTIMSVNEELKTVYGLNCEALPTHKPLIRVDMPLRIFRTEEQKEKAIISLIKDNRQAGRPTLVGCVNMKRSDSIAKLLENDNIPFNRLDAKTIKQEAITIAKAGIGNAVTVATSVAGRGTDIKPSPDALEHGGLMVIGTDLFDSVRIDKQLKGRTGRQGNPGSSVFFASLEDSILKYLSKEEQTQFETLVNCKQDYELNDPEVLSLFAKAQSNRESLSYQSRENTARKDDVVAPRRLRFYNQRNDLLFNPESAVQLVEEIAKTNNVAIDSIDNHLDELYQKTIVLLRRSLKNNPFALHTLVPFSCNRHSFAIHLNIPSVIESRKNFDKEFKRQVLLQVYDKEWKAFVIYMMGNLDSHEIDLLDDKYDRMMNEINSIVLSRLLNSTIIFDIKSQQEEPFGINDNFSIKPIGNHSVIAPDDPCPCGSKKKYRECHGRGIHGKSNMKRRR